MATITNQGIEALKKTTCDMSDTMYIGNLMYTFEKACLKETGEIKGTHFNELLAFAKRDRSMSEEKLLGTLEWLKEKGHISETHPYIYKLESGCPK